MKLLKKSLCIAAAAALVFSFCACGQKNNNNNTDPSATKNTAQYTAYQNEENGLYGFKDENGNVVIEAQFDRINTFVEDRAIVWKNKRGTYIDENANPITDYRFKILGNFSNGLAAVSEDGKKYGFIDKDGNVVIDFLYSNVDDFDENGHAQAYLDGKLITIDKTGAQVTEENNQTADNNTQNTDNTDSTVNTNN